jgi:hypothetical protein
LGIAFDDGLEDFFEAIAAGEFVQAGGALFGFAEERFGRRGVRRQDGQIFKFQVKPFSPGAVRREIGKEPGEKDGAVRETKDQIGDFALRDHARHGVGKLISGRVGDAVFGRLAAGEGEVQFQTSDPPYRWIIRRQNLRDGIAAALGQATAEDRFKP